VADEEEVLPNHSKEIRETLDVMLDTKPASAALFITVDVNGFLNYASWGIDEKYAKVLLDEIQGTLETNPEDVPPKYLN
jgi:hypothetical protein